MAPEQQMTRPDTTRFETSHRWPMFLPGGKTFALSGSEFPRSVRKECNLPGFIGFTGKTLAREFSYGVSGDGKRFFSRSWTKPMLRRSLSFSNGHPRRKSSRRMMMLSSRSKFFGDIGQVRLCNLTDEGEGLKLWKT